MRHLVDANVLSEATKPDPNPRVIEWLRRNERSIAVDPVVLGEVRFGILLLARGARRTKLEQWFEQAVSRIQCVPCDSAVGMRWAQLLADLRRRGKPMSIKDRTLNRRDFEPARVRLVDPSA